MDIKPRLIIEGSCLKHYLAKCHEALRTGLADTFDTKFFGTGYPQHTVAIKTYDQIIQHVSSDKKPDVMLICGHDTINLGNNRFGWKFWYDGIETLSIPKGVVLADYWSEAGDKLDQYINMIISNKIDFILSYFSQPLQMWKNTPIGSKLIYTPPSFDPAIFRDWNMPKTYDVGFLAAGTAEYSPFYPERHKIHNQLLGDKSIKYLWANHPGWKVFDKGHPFVGENFSKAINSCKIFITSGGIYKNAQPKIFEALASRILLMTDEPFGCDLVGLVDGKNYVKISPENIVSKIHYYLDHEKEAEAIRESGYQLAISRHSCYNRAKEVHLNIKRFL